MVAIGLGYFTFKSGDTHVAVGDYPHRPIPGDFWNSDGHLPSPTEDSLFRDLDFWLIGLMIYAFVASSLPVWLLLQPRDLINSHQLIVGLIAMYHWLCHCIANLSSTRRRATGTATQCHSTLVCDHCLRRDIRFPRSREFRDDQ